MYLYFGQHAFLRMNMHTSVQEYKNTFNVFKSNMQSNTINQLIVFLYSCTLVFIVHSEEGLLAEISIHIFWL